MPESTPTPSSRAVFLSYASQDSEAARRIAEALRAAEIEVWFDQEGGLEHGDEWDAKIRGQIKECVLFIPLISANTQSRHEGYFRLEWELAAERAMSIAAGVPFILPVVIDQTRESDALVPDRFRKVQWTRLPGGSVTPDVKQRLHKLWVHRSGLVKSAAGEVRAFPNQDGPNAGGLPMLPSPARGIPLAVWGVGIALILALVGGLWWMARAPSFQSQAPLAPSVPVTSSGAEARQLVAKVWAELERIHLDPPILATADDLARRASALDPLNPDVWAACSQVDSWFGYMEYDASPRRIESARSNAEHALRLSPISFEARLAQAVYLVRAHGEVTLPPNPVQAESLLNELLREQPQEPRTLLAAAILERNLRHYAEARALFLRLARLPAFEAAAYAELGYSEDRSGDVAAAEAAADRSIQIQPYATNLTLKLYLAMNRGDLEAAEATLDRIPADISEEDKVVSIAADLEFDRRDPQAMLKRLEAINRDWLHSVDYDGPTALWIGLARQMAGEPDAARFQWELGLKLVEQRLEETPSSGALIKWKGVFQALLGQRDESERTLKLASEMKVGSREGPPGDLWVYARTLNGQGEAVIDLWEARNRKPYPIFSSWGQKDPFFDLLRANPRVQAALPKLEKQGTITKVVAPN